jgi:VanZ family protein
MSEEVRVALTYRPLWVAVGWAMVAAVVWVSLTPRPPEVGVLGADKLAHFAAYLLLAGWFGALYAGRSRAAWGLALVLLGVVLEFLQGLGGLRQLDPWDMLANALGVTASFLASHRALARVPASVEGALRP